MFEREKILAFIPARAGSKGIKNKNIVDFAGKPLIHWTIQASLGCRYVDRTVVSTDGQQIADVAKACGADVPFLRPAEFATDLAPSDDAIRHCVHWLKEHEKATYDHILLLQPTSPLRSAKHITEAIEYYFKNRRSKNDTLISVILAQRKAALLMQRNKKGYIDQCFPIPKQGRLRQFAPDYYLPNGMVYFGPTDVVLKQGYYSGQIIPFVMEEDISVDIDTPQDLAKALEVYQRKVSTERVKI